MAHPVVLRPSAKINLTLRVGPSRPDGFHEVRTVLQSIALSDVVSLSPRSGRFALTVRGAGVPEGRENLAWQAAEHLWRAMGRTGDPRDAHVKLDKQIPLAAGLGGGSADAAAVLVGLSAIWGSRLSRQDLRAVAAALGSDVPFFLQGGTALGASRGEEIYPLDDVRRLGVVIIKPSFGVATADAYRWHDEQRAGGSTATAEASEPAADTRPVDIGWSTGPIALINDLAGPVAARHPEIRTMVQACLREGAIGASMTGSGSAVFGLFPESAARRAVDRLKRPDWLVLLTRTLSRREAARRLGV
jgi:4-diphosphocytidyl-2-C-methyl-D-erythritol kinase